MGSFMPGMGDNNAVNNSDGFSTGYLASKKNKSKVKPFNPMDNINPMDNSPMAMPVNNQSRNTNSFNFNNQVNNNSMMNQGMNNQQMNSGGRMNNSSMMNSGMGIQQPMNPGMNNQPMNPGMNNQPMNPGMNNQPMMNQNTSRIPQVGPGFNKNQKGMPNGSNNMNFGRSDQKIPRPEKDLLKKATGANVTDKEGSSGKFISLIAITLIIGLGIFIFLYFSGKINFKKDPPEVQQQPEVKDPTDEESAKAQPYIAKLNIACENLDADGNYGSQEEGKTDCSELICFTNDNPICAGGFCIITSEDIAYTKVCSTGVLRKSNKYDYQGNINLREACSVLEENPSLSGNLETSYAKCSNYECESIINGKNYTATCGENS